MDWNNFLKNYQGNPEEHIAIIGMSGRFPGASNVDKYWENLKEGRECITFFTREQLERSNLEQRLLNDPRYVGADGIIEDMDKFDAEFFGFSPREAEITDPQHRLFLECAWELMENAGYDSEHYKGRVGVYASANMSTYLIRNLMSNPELRSQATSFQTVLGNDKDFIATRVSYKLNLKGPSVNVATLCSSSAAAIHLACQSLLAFQCDMALAGAVSLQASPNEAFFYQEGGIGSPDGHCRAFDSKANGTVSGNGLGIVALKRLEDAVNEGDNILAIIRGSALNNDGASKMSFTAPGMQGQVEVITEALNLADVDPETITYVEAHGMGTPLGDPMEIEALTKAFRHGTDKTGFCAVGSVKTNIGHLVHAGGAAGLIKTVLALQNKKIPASLNYESPNPMIRFEESPFYVNTRLSNWETGTKPRRAGVNSFGIGGTNVHMILEEAPDKNVSGSARQWQLILLSARNEVALQQQTVNLKNHLSANSNINAADMAYTLQIGRKSFSNRLFFICQNSGEALDILNAYVLNNYNDNRMFKQVQSNREQLVAFIFTGDTVTMPSAFGYELYQYEPVFRKSIDDCALILEALLHCDIKQFLYPNQDTLQESLSAEVKRTALFITQYSLARLWMEWGIMPQAVFGLDWLGECLAACIEGNLSLKDALTAVVNDRIGDVKGLTLNQSQIPIASRLENIMKDSEYVFLEIGSGQIVVDTVKQNRNIISSRVVLASFDRSVPETVNSETAALLTTLGNLWLAGVIVDWNSFHAYQHRHRLPLPTYPFQRKSYWIEPMAETKAESRTDSAALVYHERPILSTPYTASRSETEADLVEIWQDLIGIRPIGVFDSFVQLGGNSLLATQIISRAREAFNIDIPMIQILEEPTIANISAYIDAVRYASKESEAAASLEIREEGEL